MTRPKGFPLIGDQETIVTPSRHMQLYEDSDLISNINGPYQDRFFEEPSEGGDSTLGGLQNEMVDLSNAVDVKKTIAYRQPIIQPTKPSLSRMQARQEIKAKRQAYLQKEIKGSTSQKEKRLPSAPPLRQPDSELRRLGQKLHQENLVLAELPMSYKEPQNQAPENRGKNSYDFLKRSQIYNPKRRNNSQEHRPVPEWQITPFEQVRDH